MGKRPVKFRHGRKKDFILKILYVVSADGPVPELLPAVCDRPGPLPGSLPAPRELLLGAHTIKGNVTLFYTRGFRDS
jgi:hypothetical protein